MIQIKRGNTENWRALKKKLASGQPGYDKVKHKLKVGDGETDWKELPYATGLFDYEILNSEKTAKTRYEADDEDTTIITYGTAAPNKETIGQLYLQHYDTEPEVDYVVECGVNGIWTYQKWHSGIAKCWGTLPIAASVQNAFEGDATLYYDNTMKAISYPFTFIKTPSETATLQATGGFTWLASLGKNTKSKSGVYSLVSLDKQITSVSYNITLQVEGFWR